MEPALRNRTFLEFLPVSIFGGVMGLCGLCFSWRLAHKLWNVYFLVGEVIGGLAICSFLILTACYYLKYLRYPDLVKSEFNNDVSVSFFATFIVSLLLIPGVLLPYFPTFATAIWAVGSLMIFVFSWYVLRRWLNKEQPPENAAPAWLLPVVGTLNVPVVGNKLALTAAHEICLFFLGIGIMFSLLLLPIIFSRLLFGKALTPATPPTLMILIGPFSLAFSAYEGFIHNLDIIGGVFFYFNFMLLLVIGSKIILLPKTCPFQVSWWAVSFPLTAFTVSAFTYTIYKPDLVHLILSSSFLCFTTLVIIYLIFQTITRIVNRNYMPI